MHILNQKGFSLVQILIAGGIAVSISIGAMQLILKSQQSEQSLHASLGKIHLQQDIQRITSEQKVCIEKVSFDPANANLSSGSAKLQVEINGADITQNNSQASSLYNLSNVEVLFENVKQIDTLPNGNFLFHGEVIISSDKKHNLIGGKQNNDIEAGELIVEVDNTLALKSCYSEESVAGSCQLMGGTYDPNKNPSCIVPPACPSGQILVSQGEHKPGKCQKPPVKIKVVRIPAPMPSAKAKKPSGNACEINPSICKIYKERLGKDPDMEGMQYWNAHAVGNQFEPPKTPAVLEQMIIHTTQTYGEPVLGNDIYQSK